MSTELVILNELAKITATQCECNAIAAVVNQHISNTEFTESFARMIDEIEGCYRFIGQILSPFIALATQSQFDTEFDTLHADYQKNYLIEASKPRHAADRAYELSIGLIQSKQFKTTYPLLKRTFDRLDYFLDKYITNDAWLVMSIDSILKRLSRFLGEIVELRKVDAEEAFFTYRALMLSIERYLNFLSPGF